MDNKDKTINKDKYIEFLLNSDLSDVVIKKSFNDEPLAAILVYILSEKGIASFDEIKEEYSNFIKGKLKNLLLSDDIDLEKVSDQIELKD